MIIQPVMHIAIEAQDSSLKPIGEDIVVVAKRSSDDRKIDRQIYTINRNAHAAAQDARQILSLVPMVLIGPNGDISLLGASGVKIMVDGRPLQGDVHAFLRGLHGADLDSIEVMTNPSAQYSSEGAAGIINFVSRKQDSDTVSGSETSELSSLGKITGDISRHIKDKRFLFDLEGHVSNGTTSRSVYSGSRVLTDEEGALPGSSEYAGYSKSYSSNISGSVRATYELTDKKIVSLKILGGDGVYNQRSVTNYKAASFSPLLGEHRTAKSRLPNIGMESSFIKRGEKDGDQFTAYLQIYSTSGSFRKTQSIFDDGSLFDQTSRDNINQINASVEWMQTMASGSIITLGSGANKTKTTQAILAFTSDFSALTYNIDETFAYKNSTLYAFSTYQFKIGGIKLLPGLRLENNSRIASLRETDKAKIAAMDLFPSLHIAKQITNNIDVDASYTKRVDRVQGDNLRPIPLLSDRLLVQQGNPTLKDQYTDSYELAFHKRQGVPNIDFLLFHRSTSNVLSSTFSVVGAGVISSSFINSGKRTDDGGEVNVSASLNRRLKGSVSFSAFSSLAPLLVNSQSTSYRTLRYSTNASLEWNGRPRGSLQGDTAQIQFVYNGPSPEYQIKKRAFLFASAGYTHSVTKEMSVSTTITYQSKVASFIQSINAKEFYSESRPVEMTIKIQKLF